MRKLIVISALLSTSLILAQDSLDIIIRDQVHLINRETGISLPAYNMTYDDIMNGFGTPTSIEWVIQGLKSDLWGIRDNYHEALYGKCHLILAANGKSKFTLNSDDIILALSDTFSIEVGNSITKVKSTFPFALIRDKKLPREASDEDSFLVPFLYLRDGKYKQTDTGLLFRHNTATDKIIRIHGGIELRSCVVPFL